MKIAAFIGPSGSGKTTAVEALIRHFTAGRSSVGAIKHTHHPLNDDDRGDTRRFRAAGADPVILAGEAEAVIFSGSDVTRITFRTLRDLLTRFRGDVLLIEGFGSAEHDWPVVELRAGEWQSLGQLLDRLPQGDE